MAVGSAGVQRGAQGRDGQGDGGLMLTLSAQSTHLEGTPGQRLGPLDHDAMRLLDMTTPATFAHHIQEESAPSCPHGRMSQRCARRSTSGSRRPRRRPERSADFVNLDDQHPGRCGSPCRRRPGPDDVRHVRLGTDRQAQEARELGATIHRFLDGRGGDHEHPGVTVELVLVVEGPLCRGQPSQFVGRQQDGGFGWAGGERPPSVRDGELSEQHTRTEPPRPALGFEKPSRRRPPPTTSGSTPTEPHGRDAGR